MQAIVADRLCKRYRLGGGVAQHGQLREDIVLALRRLLRLERSRSHQSHGGESTEIWALRDVSFEVERGELVGIIGRNGSGKSTLLKILSRITDPTEGRARVAGRVGSLLEVGTGFQPELTGRENVFLNGSILGMKRAEIKRRFDEIVDFAGIAQFIDTPVKHYSSGMYLRLAFAVAAHLETESLFIDEVLAVGDQEFQKKCLAKMDSVTREGRTLLFVSHNMAAVRGLTKRCIWLDAGRVAAEGPSDEVVSAYLASTQRGDGEPGHVDLREASRPRAPYGAAGTFPTGDLRCRSLVLRRADGEPAAVFPEGTPIAVELTLDTATRRAGIDVVLTVKSEEGSPLFSIVPGAVQLDPDAREHCLTTVMDPNVLAEGRYALDVYVQDPYPQDHVPDALHFEVRREGIEHRANLRHLTDWALGPIRIDFGWRVSYADQRPSILAARLKADE
jgi:lipopolysaccharide transport system ATP-binding protein